MYGAIVRPIIWLNGIQHSFNCVSPFPFLRPLCSLSILVVSCTCFDEPIEFCSRFHCCRWLVLVQSHHFARNRKLLVYIYAISIRSNSVMFRRLRLRSSCAAIARRDLRFNVCTWVLLDCRIEEFNWHWWNGAPCSPHRFFVWLLCPGFLFVRLHSICLRFDVLHIFQCRCHRFSINRFFLLLLSGEQLQWHSLHLPQAMPSHRIISSNLRKSM